MISYGDILPIAVNSQGIPAPQRYTFYSHVFCHDKQHL